MSSRRVDVIRYKLFVDRNAWIQSIGPETDILAENADYRYKMKPIFCHRSLRFSVCFVLAETIHLFKKLLRQVDFSYAILGKD